MPTPDVRIRLSVEGTPEAIAAFKAVHAQAQQAGKGASQAFGSLNGVLGGLRGLLGALGLALSVGALVNFGKEVLQNAERLGKLAQQVGTTVEHMSGLALAANLADTDTETLAAGLGALAKSLDALKNKAPAAVAAFARLGLTARDFPTDDTVEAFDIVSRAMEKVSNGYTKTAIAASIAGRGGKALIPVMRELAELGGQGGAEAEARRLGVMVDAATVATIRQLTDSMKILKLEAAGAALEFFKGFGPSAAAVMKGLSGEVRGTASSFRDLGQAVGQSLGWIMGVVNAVDYVWHRLEMIGLKLHGMVSRYIALARHDLPGFFGHSEMMEEELAVRQTALDSRIAERNLLIEDLKQPPKLPEVKTGAAPPDPTEAYRQRQESARTALENENKLVDAQLKVREEQEKRSFDRGLIGVRQYFQRRRDLLEQEQAAELEKLREMLKAELATPDPDLLQHQKKVADYRVQIRVLQTGIPGQAAALGEEERKAVESLTAERVSGEQKILEAQGRRHEAAMLGIETEADAWEKTVLKQTDDPAQAAAERKRYAEAVQAAEQLNALQDQLDRGLSTYESDRGRLQSSLQAAGADELEINRQLLAFDRQRLGPLKAIAQARLEAAMAAGDELAVVAAQEQIRALEGVGQNVRTLGSDLRQAFGSELASFLGRTINQVQSLGDAFRSLALDIAGAVQQLLAMRIASWILGKIMPIKAAGGGQVAGKATGGVIRGPGGPTSDSVPALLSAGEYVVQARAVAMPGALRFLESFNRGAIKLDPATLDLIASGELQRSVSLRLKPMDELLGLRRLAEGGLVGPTDRPGGQFGGTLTLSLPEGASVQDADAYLETPQGERKIIRIIARNRRAVGGALR